MTAPGPGWASTAEMATQRAEKMEKGPISISQRKGSELLTVFYVHLFHTSRDIMHHGRQLDEVKLAGRRISCTNVWSEGKAHDQLVLSYVTALDQ